LGQQCIDIQVEKFRFGEHEFTSNNGRVELEARSGWKDITIKYFLSEGKFSREEEHRVIATIQPNNLSDNSNYDLIVSYNDIELRLWKSIFLVDKNGIHFKGVIQ
jgi:hypothetical protein